MHADIPEPCLNWTVFALVWTMIRRFHTSSLMIVMLNIYEVTIKGLKLSTGDSEIGSQGT